MSDLPTTGADTGLMIPRNRNIVTFGGGDAELSLDDRQVVACAVMVNMNFKSSERDPGGVPRPIYEYAPAKRMYGARGGQVTVESSWIVHKGVEHYPRLIPLTAAQVQSEFARLMSAFRIPKGQGTWQNFTEEVYGKDVSRFYDVLTRTYKRYKELIAAAKLENRLLSDDEWETIAKITEPNKVEMPKFEFKPDDFAGAGMVVVDEDTPEMTPAMKLQGFLTGKGWDADVALAVSKMVGTDISPKRLNGVPGLTNKQGDIARMIEDIKRFEAA